MPNLFSCRTWIRIQESKITISDPDPKKPLSQPPQNPNAKNELDKAAVKLQTVLREGNSIQSTHPQSDNWIYWLLTFNLSEKVFHTD
jgi:hypothetical protein